MPIPGVTASAVNLSTSIGFKATVGNNGHNTASTTLVITTTTAIDAGDLVVVRVAADNLSATTPTVTVTDSGSNTYTTHVQKGQNATGGAGVVGAIAATKATTGIAAGGTITVTVSGSVTSKAAYAETFNGYENTVRASASNSGASTAATVIGAGADVNDLVVGAVAIESRTAPSAYDTDTSGGSWSTGFVQPSAVSGTDANNVEIAGQYKVVTALGAQTYDQTIVSTDWVGLIVIFAPTGDTDVLFEPFNSLSAWTTAGSTSIVAGRTGNAAQITNSGTLISYDIPSVNQSADVTLGFAINWSHGGTSDVVYLRSDAGATFHNKMVLSSTNQLTFTRDTTTLASSAVNVVAPGSYYYVELQARLADAGGFVIVRVNGVEVINATGLDTKSGGTKTVYDQIRFAMFDGRVNKIDDLYLTVGPGAAFKGSITIP